MHVNAYIYIYIYKYIYIYVLENTYCIYISTSINWKCINVIIFAYTYIETFVFEYLHKVFV